MSPGWHPAVAKLLIVSVMISRNNVERGKEVDVIAHVGERLMFGGEQLHPICDLAGRQLPRTSHVRVDRCGLVVGPDDDERRHVDCGERSSESSAGFVAGASVMIASTRSSASYTPLVFSYPETVA